MDHAAGRGNGTTHDWVSAVDRDHLAGIRRDPAAFAPGGLTHLVLEILAYAAEEAEANGGGRCTVTLHRDGSVSVADDGRGTAVVFDDAVRAVRKPVMATKDLRYFDFPGAQVLPDGHARRGASVVAALSEWLVHTNRRVEGAWEQRYEHGEPVADLVPIRGGAGTGTTVRFLVDESLRVADLSAALGPLPLARAWPTLSVAFFHEID